MKSLRFSKGVTLLPRCPPVWASFLEHAWILYHVTTNSSNAIFGQFESVILAGTLIMHCRRRHCGVQLIIVSPPPLMLRLKFEIEIEFTFFTFQPSFNFTRLSVILSTSLWAESPLPTD